MSATPYKPVSVGPEILDLSKIQQMANNDQWIFENTPRIRYSVPGIVKENGIRIIAGKTPYPRVGGPSMHLPVYFGSYFTAGCMPVVTATIQTGSIRKRVDVSIVGLGNTGTTPDHNGFMAVLWLNEVAGVTAFDAAGWVHWIAVGY